MKQRFRQYRRIGGATFSHHQRGLDVLAGLSLLVLVGVTITGVWQFFAHEPDPDWFDFVPDTGFTVSQRPATGMAEAHGLFGLGAGIVILGGTAWFAYRIAHSVPRLSLVAFACVLVALLTESLVRFNVIKIQGLALDRVGPGYAQVFTEDVEYVVTDVGQTGANRFRLVVLAHLATVPVLTGFAWWSIRRTLDRRTSELDNAKERTWYKSWDQS